MEGREPQGTLLEERHRGARAESGDIYHVQPQTQPRRALSQGLSLELARTALRSSGSFLSPTFALALCHPFPLHSRNFCSASFW